MININKKLITYSFILLLLITYLVLINNNYNIKFNFNKLKIKEQRKFIYFTTNLGGFNNQLQQIWIYKLIAKLTGRELVISGFHSQKDEHSFTPLSTYIDESSFLNGLPSISAAEYNSTCHSKTQIIAKGRWGSWDHNADQIKDLIDEINSLEDECLMITGHAPSYAYYWNDSFLKDYPNIMEKSLKNFKFTEKVLEKSKKFKLDHGLDNEKYMAIHLRRGDFEKHCKKHLEPLKSQAFSFNKLFGKFPVLIPEDPYIDHCFPSIKTIVKVIDTALSKLPSKPNAIFLMHNANRIELEELLPLLSKRFKKVLQFKNTNNNDDNWKDTHNLLTEMNIASESDYFIGNIHSTVTSNVIAIREVKNLPRKHVYFL